MNIPKSNYWKHEHCGKVQHAAKILNSYWKKEAWKIKLSFVGFQMKAKWEKRKGCTYPQLLMAIRFETSTKG